MHWNGCWTNSIEAEAVTSRQVGRRSTAQRRLAEARAGRVLGGAESSSFMDGEGETARVSSRNVALSFFCTVSQKLSVFELIVANAQKFVLK